MSARLQELLRQKAMLADHAAWLEREIEREQAQSSEPTAPLPAADDARTEAPAPAATPAESAVDLDAEAEAIMQQYRDASAPDHERIRLGCILYVVAAVIVALLPFLAVYLFYRAR